VKSVGWWGGAWGGARDGAWGGARVGAFSGARVCAMVCALVCAGSFGAGGCKRAASAPEEEKAEPVEVHCVPVQRQALDELVALRGRIAPPPGGDLPVASQVQGRVVSVAVKEGQHIASGDLVATVDEGPSRDALLQAEAALAQTQAAEINANATLGRTRAVVDRGIAPKQELDDATARAEAAHAGVAAAQAGVDLARRTLNRVFVRSSFDGVVTRIWRGPGAIVDGTSATPVIQLAAAGGAEFVADATAGELSAIAEGQPVHGELAMDMGAFDGVVRARSSSLDPATGLGVVRVALQIPATQTPMGSFGRIVVTTAHRDAVLVIPSAAIRGSVADGAEIAECKDGKAHLHTVKVGWRDDARIEVLDGVTEGEKLAVDHVLGLDDDTPITEANEEKEKGPEKEDGGK
jgi:RND family efflux transporter MFP subunit